MTADPQPSIPTPTIEDWQHWTWVAGRAQQMLIEHGLKTVSRIASAEASPASFLPPMPLALQTLAADPVALARAQGDFWANSVAMWQKLVTEGMAPLAAPPAEPVNDRRFRGPQWQDNPLFDFIRQSYLQIADMMMRTVDALDGVDPQQKEQLRFVTRGIVDAMSPSNFALTNPEVLARTIETRGENLLKGLEHMLADLEKGQLTHSDPQAFEVGRNIAVTPGKVIHETPLYQLIQYQPTTPDVLATPLVIFPPWINRFYILDLNPEKSFIKWCVDQGISVFVVSWKSADASMKDVVWDDYILRGQVDAIDTVRDLLGVDAVHAIGYCVAGTTLAATMALLAARGEAAKVKSATFFTAQVDFSLAGDLRLFVDERQLAMIESVSADGYLDGRYMAATFNMLRGRDLIWSYVVNNYLMGHEYPPFDLLHWNGDTTNLPAKWHKSYLTDLYRDNRLVQPGSIVIDGTPLDLSLITTPAYIQAGREDHIAPAESVWKLTEHLRGPRRFVLAGSGHIAGVVNPPHAHKYQYWTNAAEGIDSFDRFIAGATETAGSWWPDWIDWLRDQDDATVPAKGARIPGKGRRAAIEDAPGRYARTR